jgi:hypothetical protein
MSGTTKSLRSFMAAHPVGGDVFSVEAVRCGRSASFAMMTFFAYFPHKTT